MRTELLDKPLDAANVKTRQQSGVTMSYIEGYHAINEANRIFGFDGWSLNTRDINLVQAVQDDKGKWIVGYTCICVVTVGEVVRYGAGFGQGNNPDLGRAHESAIKEAETDAMKRALRTFGNQFGLALYDKEQRDVVHVELFDPRKWFREALTPEQQVEFKQLCEARGVKSSQMVVEIHEQKVTGWDAIKEYLTQ